MNQINVEVIKIGGSFLSSPESLGDVLNIARSSGKAVLVVSAFKGVTDRLQNIYPLNTVTKISEFQAIVSWHARILEKSPGYSQESSAESILRGLYNGDCSVESIIEKVGTADYDEFLSTGERLSAVTVGMYLEHQRIKTKTVFSDALGVTVTERGQARIIDIDATSKKTAGMVERLLAEGDIIVTTGFFGRDSDGRVKILGRNSSDYSAVGIAASIGQSSVTLLKDVTGIYRADPKLLPPGSGHIPVLSYGDALNICLSGSKVVHPSAVELAMETGVRINVRRHGDSSGGTLICRVQEKQVTLGIK